MFDTLTPSRVADIIRRNCASNASAGAGRIVKAASDTFGFRLAGIFQQALAAEAQDIPTSSIPYDDLEMISQYPTVNSPPIIVGFSLPPYYLSCTASTKFVVNVFCQLVSFVHDNQAWDQYVAQPTPVVYSLVPVCNPGHCLVLSLNMYAKAFRELERSWTGDKALNRDLLSSLGTSMCTNLVKVNLFHAICICGDILLDSIGIVS